MADKETVIGVETRIAGEIRGDEDLIVKGRVDGKIQLSRSLTVDKGAIVQADVDVKSLLVAGTLVGNIVASESVRLQVGARVVGDLASPRLLMELGAAYRGRVDMGDIDTARAAVAAHAAARPSASSVTAARERPSPPRVAAPPRSAVLTAKAPPRLVAPAGAERPATAAPTAPPAFPRVAGAVPSVMPTWAKKKVRRR